jgi:ABC-type multidrug transport system fused ATPase/permease subunit
MASAAEAAGRVIADYRSRAEGHQLQHEQAAQRARWLGYLRLAIFVGGVLLLAFLVAQGIGPQMVWIAVIAATIVFALVVRRHRRLVAAARRQLALVQAYEVGINRVGRVWSALPPPIALAIPAQHPFADDLNLGGNHSLARLVGPVSAGAGQPVLAEWLLADPTAEADDIRARQSAIAELEPLTDWREELGVIGHGARLDEASLSQFLAWAERDDRLMRAGWLKVLVRAMTVLTVAAIVAAGLGLVAPRVALYLAIANAALFGAARKRLSDTVRSASVHGFNLAGLARMFRHVSSRRFESALLNATQARVDGDAAAAAIDRLAQIATCAETRYSPMGHMLLQVTLLWDFHVVDALESWRSAHGRAMRERLRAIGEIEALSALAALAHDNPTWTYPDFSDSGAATIEARALGHPLLPVEARVSNDVTLGPPGTFLLVTGSNMAGKSTLLRTVGLNLVLAQLGAPVCAERLRTPVVRVRTSIHVRDALEQGISLYMAELMRVKAIVDDAGRRDAPVVVYLLDEVLHGTNSMDRREAVAAVVGHLLRAGAIGAVSTHDLELISAADLAPRARPVHLSEQYEDTPAGPRMRFDYRLHPGLASTRNALALLEMMGL